MTISKSLNIQNLKGDIFFASLCLFSTFPILPNAIQSISVISLSLIALLFVKKFKKSTIIYVGLFSLLLLWSYINSENTKEYFDRFKILVPLFLSIPIFFSIDYKIEVNKINILFYLYCFSLVFYIGHYFNYYFTGYELYQENNMNVYPVSSLTGNFKDLDIWNKILFFSREKYAFYNSEYAYQKLGIKTDFFRHPLYLNLNLLFALIFNLKNIISRNKLSIRILNTVFVVIFSLFILYLHNESKYIVAICILSILFVNVTRRIKQTKIIIPLIIISLASCFLFLYNFSFDYNSLLDMSRVKIYQSIIANTSIFKFIFGVGLGDVQDYLISILPAELYSLDINKNYVYLNTHNQFLDILLSFGFMGLLFFLYYYFSTVWNFFKKTMNIEYTIYSLFFFIFLMIENIINRSWGVYTLFFVIIVLYFQTYVKEDLGK